MSDMPKIQVRNDINARRVILDVADGAVVIRMPPEYAIRLAQTLIDAAASS